jgi:tripartite ATP-independent transporter DctP family solute receptor
MKKTVFTFTCISLIFAVVFLFVVCTGSFAAEPIKMKIGLSNEPGSPRVRGAELFGKLIKERTNGQVEVKVYPSSQLGATRQMFEQIQMGSLECTLTPTSYFGAFSRMITIVDLPFIFPDIKTYYKVMTGPFGDELSQETQKAKMEALAFWTAGWKQFTANFPVRKPIDFKGHKVRVMPSPALMEQYRSYGATPVPIDLSELYNALQLGTVDAQENMLYRIEEMKYYEVQKYITISNHALMPEIIVVGKAWWDKLPQDIQKKMTATFREIAPEEAKWIEEDDARALKTFEKHGNIIYRLTPEEWKEFQKLAPPVWDKFVAEYGGKSGYYLEKLKAAIAAAK